MIRAGGIVLLAAGLSCAISLPGGLRIETEYLLLNLTRDRYAAFEVRENDAAGSRSAEPFTPVDRLLPAGALLRGPLWTLFPQSQGCPDRIDVRVYLYERINADVPIGLDPGEPSILPWLLRSSSTESSCASETC